MNCLKQAFHGAPESETKLTPSYFNKLHSNQQVLLCKRGGEMYISDAKINSYEVNRQGTYLDIFIPDKCLLEEFAGKKIHTCDIAFDDGRHITNEQRKKIYATLSDIALHTGYLPDECKQHMKYYHMARTGSQYFSLSNCSLELAKAFINTLLEYALAEGVILKDLGVNRTDDIDTYLFQCLKHKKCAVCGRKGEIHHVDTIGMGNNRNRVNDSEYRKICLCRTHHTEAHSKGMSDFEKQYKVYGIIYKN